MKALAVLVVIVAVVIMVFFPDYTVGEIASWINNLGFFWGFAAGIVSAAIAIVITVSGWNVFPA